MNDAGIIDLYWQRSEQCHPGNGECLWAVLPHGGV